MSDRPAPLISIVTPVYNPPVDVLAETIESVLAQTYDDWELILVDDCSPEPAVRETLRRFAARDPRIRVIERAENGHIVRASNDGIDAARGEFIGLLDHDDLLTPKALARNAQVIAEHDDVDYLYSDEDKIDDRGRFFDRFEKPTWSPERLRAQNYCCHFSVLRTEAVRRVGGFREGFDGSQDHDLILRVTEVARRIVHIPEVLYHWRTIPGSAAAELDAKPYAAEAGRRAVAEHVVRMGIDAEVLTKASGLYSVLRRPVSGERRTSVVIPTIGSSAMVWGRSRVLVVEAVRSAIAKARHPENLEIVVVYDDPTPQEVLDQLWEIAGSSLVLVPFHERFNYSRKVNFGVLASSGDRLILLNDDVEVITEGWVDELLGPLEEPDVGMTGAKLLFSNTSIQHAGLAFLRGGYHHPFREQERDFPGQFRELLLNREVTGLTGACIAMRREVYLEVGGLPEGLPVSFNDVDLSYKVARKGYRMLYLPGCELFHFESQTRETEVFPKEFRFIHNRWGVPDRDPFTPVYPDLPLTPSQRRRKALEARRRGLGLPG
ncbi:MAG TPA: glycosyltransferase [Nocardioides sp.]|uniref:glycosyltransferase family 2 protein n=1 Tax=Nocardioides sp. TaxID=35761 RepID=UPI002EDA2383